MPRGPHAGENRAGPRRQPRGRRCATRRAPGGRAASAAPRPRLGPALGPSFSPAARPPLLRHLKCPLPRPVKAASVSSGVSGPVLSRPQREEGEATPAHAATAGSCVPLTFLWLLTAPQAHPIGARGSAVAGRQVEKAAGGSPAFPGASGPRRRGRGGVRQRRRGLVRGTGAPVLYVGVRLKAKVLTGVWAEQEKEGICASKLLVSE